VSGLFELGEGRFHARQVLCARFGQCERARAAREERGADFLFQRRNDA